MQILMAQQEDAVTPKEWLTSTLEEIAPKATAVWEQWGMAVLITAAVIATVIATVRLVGGWHARRTRKTVLLKPSSKFDPSSEEVLRFCGQLARVHSATARVTVPRSTRMLRVTLTSAGEGRMAQLLSGPAGAEQILRHRGFAQVELADPSSILGARTSGPGSEATQEDETAEPSELISSGAVQGERPRAAAAVVDDPLDPDLEVGPEEWLDGDHGGFLDGPPEALEWIHPEEQRLHPVPGTPWDCLEEDDSR